MRFASVALAAALAVSSPALAWSFKAGDLAIGHPWSRPAAAGMNGAGFLTVTNSGKTADVLLTAETPVATKVEIHGGSTAGGVMRMKKVAGGLPIAPGQTLTLAPGGHHLMLLKLKQPLKAGDRVPATLVFQKAGRVAVTFHVQATPGAHRH